MGKKDWMPWILCLIVVLLVLILAALVTILIGGGYYILKDVRGYREQSAYNTTKIQLQNDMIQADVSSLRKELETYRERIGGLQESVEKQHESISKNTLMVERLNRTVTNAVKVVEQVNHTIKANSEVLSTVSKKMDNVNQSLSAMDAKTTTILSVTQENMKLAQHSMTVMAMMNNTMADNIQSLHTTVTHGTGTILESINNTNGNVVGVSKLVEELKEKLETLSLPLNLTEILDYLEENSIAIQNVQTDIEYLGAHINLTFVNSSKILHEIKGKGDDVIQMLILQGNATTSINYTRPIIYHEKEIQVMNNCTTHTSEIDNQDVMEELINNTNRLNTRMEKIEQQLIMMIDYVFWSIIAAIAVVISIILGAALIAFAVYTVICRSKRQAAMRLEGTGSERVNTSNDLPVITGDDLKMKLPVDLSKHRPRQQISVPPCGDNQEKGEIHATMSNVID